MKGGGISVSIVLLRCEDSNVCMLVRYMGRMNSISFDNILEIW